MYTFNHHNGIVHYDGNGKHHSREGEQVDWEANNVERKESTNQCYGDSNRWDNGASHILQEDIHHNKHEDKCLDKGLNNLVDRGKEEVVDVLCHGNLHTLGQCLLCFVEQLFAVLNNFSSIWSCHLRYHTGNSLMAIYLTCKRVSHTTQLYACYILQTDNRTIVVGLDNNVLELGNLTQTTFVAQGVLESLVFAFTNITWSSFNILFSQNTANVSRHQVVFSHLFRIKPNTHRVVGTHHLGITYTLYTLNLRNDIDFGIVLNKRLVIAVLSICYWEDEQHWVLTLLCNHTYLSNFRGQQTLCFCHTVLYVHGSHIGVGTHLKGNLDRGRTSIGCSRCHVVHVFYTIDLLFKRSNHRVQHGLCICTRISGAHLHGRWCDVRILDDREWS